ncbi:DNA gyrase subunit A [candidate division BRC1 bacterium SM23_51]|nr:MAG: DNA gyrase subunit A [candidate division BRC1 bacterium SM23_51]
MQDTREQIVPISLEEEMKSSYIDFAMSVIVGRALPDVRDGLKPVHRRIIYAMNQLNLTSGRPYKKSAAVVGDVIAKYHPHGDQAVYDTLVRMAQEFSLRYTLVDGQGNFGSIDGDPPAAYRYTEARMSRHAELLLQDIDRQTVDFRPNFDSSTVEPEVLPSAIPHLLVNGSSGIAVGMATNIPSHNMREVIDVCVLLIDDPDAELAAIMNILPGPDFPTGGFIYGREGIAEAYRTGRGRIVLRARINTEQLKGGREALVVTEIPYQVNKSRLLEEIAHLVRDKKIKGISEVRDESDRDGMRIVLELRKGEPSQIVINQLYKHTQLQNTFGVILLALVDGRPRYLSLAKVLRLYLDHRREVVVRRTRFDLEKAERRLHIVEGLRKALDHIDDVIETIRSSKDQEEARGRLMRWFELTQEQADAILDMRLARLTNLERSKLDQEYHDLKKTIKALRTILEDPAKVQAVIKKELLEVREKYGDDRRTVILDSTEEMTVEDLIAEENMVITVSHAGYIKRTPTSLYRRQRRGGKGVAGMDTKEEDWVAYLFIGTTHHYMMFFTDRGRAYWLKIYELPQGGRATRGRPVVNILQLDGDERIQAMIPVREFDDQHFLLMATARGQIVKNALSLYANPRRVGINAIRIEEGDRLIDVKMTSGNQDVIIGTRNGMAIRFNERDVRAMGRYVQGVRAITLRGGDEVVGIEVCRPQATILTVCEKGYGKRTQIDEYRLTRRGGIGVINIKTTERNGKVIDIKEVLDDEELIMITQKGISIRCPVQNIRVIGRSTQGVRLIDLKPGDRLTDVARLGEKVAPENDSEPENGGEPEAPAEDTVDA